MKWTMQLLWETAFSENHSHLGNKLKKTYALIYANKTLCPHGLVARANAARRQWMGAKILCAQITACHNAELVGTRWKANFPKEEED